MTDNEIIQALDERTHSGKWIGKGFLDKTDYLLLTNALNLINRQQKEIKEWKIVVENCQMQHEKDKAELERLNNECFCLSNERDAYKDIIDTSIAEAIKEFAERLKKEKQQSVKARFSFGGEYISNGVMCADIDDLVAEMVGDE